MDIQRATQAGDDAGVLAAADRMLARTNLPLQSRMAGVIARANVLNRRAGRGDAEAGRQAETFIRAELERPYDGAARLALIDQLATNLSNRTPPRTEEALAEYRRVAEGSAVELGPDHPSSLGRLLRYGVQLNAADHDEEALIVLDGLLARDARRPGLLDPEDRALTETARASALLSQGRFYPAYVSLRSAGTDYRDYALSERRRDDARGLLASRSYLFRTQVQIGWALYDHNRPAS